MSTTAAKADFKVADLGLAEFGRKEIRLAEHEMPGLMAIRREYADGSRCGRADHRVAAHDDPDRGADRDAGGARGRGPLGVAATSSRPRTTPRRRSWWVRRGLPRIRRACRSTPGRGRRSRSTGGAPSRPCRWPGDSAQRPEHDPRRRRRRHAARPQGGRVRARRRGARSGRAPTPRSSRSCSGCSSARSRTTRSGSRKVAAEIQGVTEETTTGVHRLYQFAEHGDAAVPGDQRQRLGHQEQVRQQVRLPALADRRDQPRHRRDDRRQAGGDLRLRRRRQGLRGVAARAARPRGGHRDRPDLRAPGGDGRLSGAHARGRRRHGGHLHHRDGQSRRDHGRAHGADEASGDRRKHRPLRQRDRHGRLVEGSGHQEDRHQAAG